MFWPEGDSDSESTSLARLAFDSNFSFMGIDNEFSDAQAQTAAAGSAGKAAVNLVELREYLLD